jgi:hypothetical protein
MRLLRRRALLGLLVGGCALAFPGMAAANVTPTLTITPNGPAGATGQTLTYDLSFASTGGDTVKSLTTSSPAGMLADSTIDNDQCLVSFSTSSACQVASGTATIGATSGIPAAEYLEPAPSSADVAGVALYINGSQAGNTADVTVRPGDAGLDVAFTNLPPEPLSALDLTLTGLRLPSSCSTEQMTVNTVSAGADSESTSADYASTGCPSQTYAPKVTAQINGIGNGGAEVIANITQNADEAASKSITLDLPSSLTPNVLADASCLQGTSCPIGTASALTPLAPPQALANGTVTLGGSLIAPTITVAFPAPYDLSFTGEVNLSSNSVTVPDVPDVPITSLSLDIKNTPHGPAFLTNCQAGSLGAGFTGQGGQTSNSSAPISYGGSCAIGPPSASSSVSGLGSGHPVLKLKVTRGSNATKIAKVAIALGKGLSFSSAGLVKKCTGHGRHQKCKLVGEGLSISGAKLATIKLRGGKLVLAFKHAVSEVKITVRGPLLAESKNLRRKVKKHKIKKLSVTVKVYDQTGKRTAILLYPRA